ncbi:N-chimaerin-like isoform X1 [Pecten maximus]|uniref:N-chimaerin-like isoform X1 n=1 Tax=Pecten maximus TaxID=6579 RepID=UPI001458D1BC|nr:N-chimaerin-like isoform X1 [Pecten maximus]
MTHHDDIMSSNKEKGRQTKSRYYNMTYHSCQPGNQIRSTRDGGDSQPLPTWKTYLYTLQLQAPKPRRIICQYEVPNKPQFYGKEYHGNVTRDEAERLLCEGDGCYLVRKSDRAPDAFTLAIRFEGQTKNFKLYYDGMHYVGEKRFDTVHDLVADGLIHFYVEAKAADYIASLSNESNYAESPYLAYSAKKKRLQRSQKSVVTRKIEHTDSGNANVDGPNRLSNGSNGTSVQAQGQVLEDDDDDILANVHEFEKAHNFKTQNFMGLHWCDYCANFMWGLIAQGVKCQDCGFEAHKKCSEKVPNDCMPDIKFVKNLYGADLTTVVKARNTPIPVVVEKCIKEIESRGLDSEGLYRIAGLHDEVEGIRMAFDKDGENTDISVNKYDDINSITSVLKLYFRLLPIPLLTFDAYKFIIDVIKRDDVRSRELIIKLKEGLSILPPAHYQTLKYLLAHLIRVTEKKSKNMMGSDNLAIVFAPTLMRSPDTNPMISLMAAQFEQKCVELLLVHYRELFSRMSTQISVDIPRVDPSRLVDHV